MPRRISKVPHEYASRDLKVGEAFECDASDVPLMLALGRIEPEPGEVGHVAAAENAEIGRGKRPARKAA